MALQRQAAPIRDAKVPQGEEEAEARPSRTWQFSKTKMCKFNLIGMCMKGEQCPFAHEKTELRTLPDLTCTKLCKTLIQTGACNDAGCTYAHSKEELRATSTFHKTKLCRFSQIGHCALGSKCNFAHSTQEIRPLDTSLAPDGDDQPLQQEQQLPREQHSPQQQGQPIQQQQQQQLLLQLNQQQQQQLQQQQQQLQQQQQALLQQQQQNQIVALALQQQIALATTDGLAMPACFEGIAGDRLQQLQYLPVPLAAGPMQTPAACPTSGSNVTSTELPSSQPAGKEVARRRGGRRGKGNQRNAAREGAPAAKDQESRAVSGGFDKPAEGVGPTASIAGPTSNVGGISGLGSLGNMSDSAALDWMTGMGATRQNAAPCLPGPLSATAAAFGGQGAGTFGGQPLSQIPPPSIPAAPSSLAGSDDFRDAPAYVTLMESDLTKSTFLENELGPIGMPIRPIRSAAGRLDLLGGEDSADELRDLEASDVQGPYGLSSSAGLVSFGPPVFGGAGARLNGGCGGDVAAGLGSRFRSVAQARSLGKDLSVNSGDRAASSGATSAGSSQVGLSSHSSNGGLSGANEGNWDSSLFNQGSFNMDQKEDVWQVKNTFLTLTPQVKPIRSVRTAEGALCALGSLLDDEP